MTVVGLGPGIGREPETFEFVHEIVKQVKCPMVIDADGLNAFQDKTELLDGSTRPLVLTPHPGEMSRLTGMSIKAIQADRLNVARKFAREHHLVLVLKGNNTIVALPDGQAWVNPTGNPGMATGGTGDILTGMTAGVIARCPMMCREPQSQRCICTAWPETWRRRPWASIRSPRPICCGVAGSFPPRGAMGRARAWRGSGDEYRGVGFRASVA